MSWRTNAVAIVARNIGRKIGFNKLLSRFLLGKRGYEANYDARLSATVQPGYCVWDIGANVGYYTKMFSERVGRDGCVYAFEPSPANYARLEEACSKIQNIKLFQFGLGREDGRLAFQQGADDLGATSRVCPEETVLDSLVEIRSGKSLLDSGEVLPPNVIKIDVEGFEYEVIEGLSAYLSSPTVKSIGIEVHFGILEERGLSQAPRWIERLLNGKGFVVTWADPSHIIATRNDR